MNNNYEFMQKFLDFIKEFAISNPTNLIDERFVYSQLVLFGVKDTQLAKESVVSNFNDWMQRYISNPNINVRKINESSFLWFQNGRMKGNEIKLYIPMDYSHIKEGANQLFDFIASTGIEHQSKIAAIIRNDNVVVRVNTMEDAQKVIQFVMNNKYIQEGMIKVNPFLPNCNGVGITMDNSYSFNSVLSQIISDFINSKKMRGDWEACTIEELNKFIVNKINSIQDLDLKDIYSILSKTTSRNFKLQEFANHANNKLCDKYDYSRKRIINPEYYLENAIKITEQYHPGNSKRAILEYLKFNANYFTNKERARQGLLKYVHPGDLINLMRKKLSENGNPIPNNDEVLIDKYLDIILYRERMRENENLFIIIKNAFLDTMRIHGKKQASVALKMLIEKGNVEYFTNRINKSTRKILKQSIAGKNIISVILNNIDIDNLNFDSIDEIVSSFYKTVVNSDSVQVSNTY